jgi:hypothetical protein
MAVQPKQSGNGHFGAMLPPLALAPVSVIRIMHLCLPCRRQQAGIASWFVSAMAGASSQNVMALSSTMAQRRCICDYCTIFKTIYDEFCEFCAATTLPRPASSKRPEVF